MDVEKPFQCTICDLKFTTNAAKKIHMSKHGKRKTFKCPLCGEIFSDPTKLRKHRLDICSNRNPEVSSLCGICDMKFYRPVAREKHMQESHGISDPQCFHCDYKPIDLEDLEEHVKTHLYKPSRKFICPECGNTCNTNGMLIHHMKTHKEVESFSCTYCDFVGKNLRGIRGHIAHVHTKKKQKTAFECRGEIIKFAYQNEKNFLPNNEIQVEISNVNASEMIMNGSEEVEEKPITCMECAYIAKNPQDLTRHIETHILFAMSGQTSIL